MAEQFHGRTHTVRFSNGAVEELLQAWILIGERQLPSLAMEPVLAFLRRQLQKHGAGWRAFSLDPPPPELAAPAQISCLASILAVFITDLCHEQPETLPGLGSIRLLRLSWLARILDLYELVVELLPEGARPDQTLALELDQQDQRECDIERLSSRIGELMRATPLDYEALILRSEQRLRLAEAGAQLDEPDSRLAIWYWKHAELLISQGQLFAAVAALRASAAREADADVRQALEEYATTLEQAPEAESTAEGECAH